MAVIIFIYIDKTILIKPHVMFIIYHSFYLIVLENTYNKMHFVYLKVVLLRKNN